MTTDYGLNETTCAPIYEKTPDEVVRVDFPWATRLDGETISTTAYELPDGLTNDAEIDSGTVQSIRISGGTNGHTYRVTCTITTSGTRTLQWTKRVWVRET